MAAAETALLLACTGLFGACAGSFLGVVIHRLPRGLSIVSPPSRCGACGTMLAARDNLPILGWLLLRGRCRHCGTAIPASCLWLEAGTAAASMLVAWAVLARPQLWCQPLAAAGHPALALGAGLAACLALTWLLIAAVLIDWEHLIIPDELTKGLQALAIPLAAATGSNLIWQPGLLDAPARALGLIGASASLSPEWWFLRWDALDGWIGTPEAAAWRLAAAAAIGLGLIAASVPLARRIYGALARDPWSDADHRAMRLGAWWFIGTTALWTALAVAVIAASSPASLTGPLPARLFLGWSLVHAVLGALAGWWLPWLVGLVGTPIFQRNAMGFGDVKLFAALGAFLGPIGTVVAFMLATVAGAVIGLPARLLGGGREVPFGPCLAAGAVLAVALGPLLLDLAARHLRG